MKPRTPPIDLLSACILFFIAALALCSGQETSSWPILGAALAIIILGLLLLATSYRRLALFPLLALFCCLGAYSGLRSSRAPIATDHLYNITSEPEEMVLLGILAAMPHFDGKNSQAVVDLQAIRRWSSEQTQPARGRVLLRLPAAWPESLAPGTMLAARASVQQPRGATSPGLFDYADYLARKDIWQTATLRSPVQLRRIEQQPAARSQFRYWPEALRYRIGLFLDSRLPPEDSALYRAVLIGDGSRLTAETEEIFKASGTMHILVISGAHIALLALFCFSLSYWLLRRSEWLILHAPVKKLAWLLCLPLLTAYSLLAGGDSPVIRSLVMTAIGVLALLLDRSKAILPLILLAAFLLLLHSPQALFTASFQLSFLAVLVITATTMAAAPYLFTSNQHGRTPRSWFLRLRSGLTLMVLIAVAASVGMAPLVLHSFNRFALIGPFATLLIEPIISFWSLLCGFIALPFMPLWPDLAAFLLQVGAYGLQLAVRLASFFAGLPHASIWRPSPPLYLSVFFYIALFLVFFFFARQQLRRALLSAGALLVLFSGLFIPLPSIFSADPKAQPAITFLDVGQGSATLIELPEGRTILIDAGGSSYQSESVGSRIIAPYLWHKGIRRLDMVAATHTDADHTNGLPFIVEHFSPRQIWVNRIDTTLPSHHKLLQSAREQAIPVVVAEAGEKAVFNSFELHCLANIYRPNEPTNAGLVLHLRGDSLRVLFPGDIDTGHEKQLLARGIDLTSTALLAAHHGSQSSNSPVFLQEVQPQLVIVSAGRDSSGNFPAEKLRQYCQENNLVLLTTRDQGSIQLTSNAAGLQVLAFPPDHPPLRGGVRAKTILNLPATQADRDQTSVKSEGGLRMNFRKRAFSTALE